MKSLLRIVLLTACAWTCVFSQTTKIYPTQLRGFSAVTATSSAITMAPGGVWGPGVQNVYGTSGVITHNSGNDTGLFTLGYNSSGQRVCFHGTGIAMANYSVAGFAGNTCTTPAPSTGIFVAATAIISAGVFGTPVDLRTDAFAVPSNGSSLFDPLNVNTLWFADSFGWTLGANGTYPPWWFASGAGSAAAGAPSAIDPGVVTVSSGSTTGSGMNLYRSASNSGWIADFSAQSPFPGFTFKSRVQLANTTNAHFRFGLFGAIGSETSANQIGIRFDTSAGDTRWMCEVRNNGSTTVTSPSALPAIDTNWHTLTIAASANGAVVCSVDGVTTITTGAFPSTAWQFGFGIWTKENAIKSAGISDVRGTMQVTGR